MTQAFRHLRKAPLVLLCLLPAVRTPAASGPAVDFNRDIRPIISAKCYHCHGPDETSRKARLRLDVRAEAIADRKGSTAIAPGSLARSELWSRINSQDPDDVMPPPKEGHPLTATEVQLLKRWIEQGAPYAEHWAFMPPQRPPVPKISGAAFRMRNPVDHFIAARLKTAGLKQSPPADRYTLIRRASLDLTGLPPTPEEADSFVKDKSPDAFGRVVDRLLASPAFGERWARVWLDLARYADSAGYGSDPLRLNIWPYRDWVIKAFNRNLPYDQFTREQIAGDLLPDPTEEQFVATAFHRNTMTNTEGGTDDEEFRVAAVKDRIATTAQVWMGLTMGCAQCHSHKYDPISHREYYSFFALFNQTEDNDQPDEKPTLPLPTKAERAKMDKLKGEIAAEENKIKTPTPALLQELAGWRDAQLKGIDWKLLEPGELISAGGATLQKLEDNSVLADGKSPDTDTYTVKVRTGLAGITAFRLELLPDEARPENGLGRSTNARPVLNSLKVAVLPVKTEPKHARFVRLELPGEQRILALAEVQVFSGGTNVALRGTASQSSTAYDGAANLAIDGKTDGEFAAKSTTHTRTEDNPWWEVDLGEEFPADEIIIWNRTDNGTGTRLNGFKVLALDAARKPAFETTVKEPPGPSKTVSLLGEKTLTLQNATADFSAEKFEVTKAIDGDEKSGWSPGPNARPRLAIFETGGMVGDTNGVTLIFTLAQTEGKQATLGRFRLSATTQARPIRVVPEKIKTLLALEPDRRTDAQVRELAGYFGEIAPSLAQTREQRDKLKKDLDAVKPVAIPVMRELAKDKQRATKIMLKGNFLTPGDPVAAGFPAAFSAAAQGAPTNRLGVAQWLTSPANPLTARVAVNRFWAQLFGAGLVETEEDFGSQGQLPSHPELLDWLATEFMGDGRWKTEDRAESSPTPNSQLPSAGSWDMKALLKLIVMSATYQQSSVAGKASLEKDARNRLLSHYPRRRLDAESVRDQALAISGLLSRKIGGPSVYPPQPDGLWKAAFNSQRSYETSQGEDRYRRGLYTFWRRTVPYPSMATFDAPSRENCTLRRLPTNTPLQAFVTLNDPAFVEMAQALGRRLVKEGGVTVADRARYGLKLALARPPTGEQVKALVSLFEKELANYRANVDGAKKLATDPLGPLPKDMEVAEQAAWTVVANVLLNLDGVLTKG